MLLLRETIIDGADHSKNDAKEGPEECAPCLRSKTHNDHHIAMLMKMLMMVNAHGDVMLADCLQEGDDDQHWPCTYVCMCLYSYLNCYLLTDLFTLVYTPTCSFLRLVVCRSCLHTSACFRRLDAAKPVLGRTS